MLVVCCLCLVAGFWFVVVLGLQCQVLVFGLYCVCFGTMLKFDFGQFVAGAIVLPYELRALPVCNECFFDKKKRTTRERKHLIIGLFYLTMGYSI